MKTLAARNDTSEGIPPPPNKDEVVKRKILVVDDDPSIGELLSGILTREGFDCVKCLTGNEALASLADAVFDAVITDVNMPGMNGLDLLKRARQSYPGMAILMATGLDDVRIGIQAMKDGADDYLVKPFELQAVMVSVNRALEKKAMEIELENYRKRLELMVKQRTKQLEAASKRIELTYDDTLEALSGALDLRDNDTAGHSRRVMRYSLAIAELMHCSIEQTKDIARGAFLHDIGKIGTPDAILLKPGKLSAEEWTIMETHARIGYELVSRISFLSGAAQIVLTHHERYDGTGYPQGLSGEEIPLGSRIFVIGDTLDAMTTDRPYRRALPYAVAREEIIRETGCQFDPNIVEHFLSIPEKAIEAIRLGRYTSVQERALILARHADFPGALSA